MVVGLNAAEAFDLEGQPHGCELIIEHLREWNGRGQSRPLLKKLLTKVAASFSWKLLP